MWSYSMADHFFDRHPNTDMPNSLATLVKKHYHEDECVAQVLHKQLRSIGGATAPAQRARARGRLQDNDIDM